MGSVFSISCSGSINDVVNGCSGLLVGQAKYVCQLEENLDALRTAMEKLKEIKNDVNRKVDIAEGQQMKRLDQVEGWLSRVEVLENEVNELIAEATEEIEKKCLGGCGPKNCMSSYNLGKKVATNIVEVDRQKTEGEQFEDQVAISRPPAPVVEQPSEPTVGLESTFHEVLRYFYDEKVGVIGLYGMGGVGKTALSTKINNELCNTRHHFNVVIWVVVSKSPNLAKIQDVIGKKIGFQIDTNAWKNKSQEERASDIYNVLKEKKFVVFLDDIWERFDLLKVGIPLPNEQNKSMLVFTTRFKDVCGRMKAHKIVEVKCLEWKEAWDLFQKNLDEGTLSGDPDIAKLAEYVARKCKGLPLALITISRAMACKNTPKEWLHALNVLKKNAADFSGMGDEVFPLLKFSYDSLPSNTNIRSCFLYCCLFPEDDWISKADLIEYWIGEEFLDEFEDIDEAQNEGHDIIGTLIRACLLEEESRLSDQVKMHDVIRDMALWIACECGRVKDKVLVQAGDGLKVAPKVEKWMGVVRMSLMRNDIQELTEAPSCLNLLTLFLNRNNKLKMISPDFFQHMPNLRILDLSLNNRLKELPMEISKLVSLRYLNLFATNIRELPIELKNLVELKYLNLERTWGLDILGPHGKGQGLVSSFKKLVVLKMCGCGTGRSSDLLAEESIVREIEGLRDLNYFSIHIKTTSALSLFLCSAKLLGCTRRLDLKDLRDLQYLNLSISLQKIRFLDDLSIISCKDLEEMTFDEGGGDQGITNLVEIKNHSCSFHGLRIIRINMCPMLKEVTWLIFAPNLEYLDLRRCDRMEEVIGGGKWGEAAEVVVFPKLKSLTLLGMRELKSIFPNALPFTCLRYIQVLNCNNLKKLPLNSDSASKGCGLVIEGYEGWWNELEWEDDVTRTAFLPSFKKDSKMTLSLYLGDIFY